MGSKKHFRKLLKIALDTFNHTLQNRYTLHETGKNIHIVNVWKNPFLML